MFSSWLLGYSCGGGGGSLLTGESCRPELNVQVPTGEAEQARYRGSMHNKCNLFPALAVSLRHMQ